MKRLKYEIYEVFEMFFSITPGTLGKYLRQYFYKLFLKKCGKALNVGSRVKIQVPQNIEIGNNTGFNYGTWIAANEKAEGKITIGNNVLVGPYTIIHSGNHVFKEPNVPIKGQGYVFGRIDIEDDVWIAARCTILSGVKIGKGSVIAAGSVVTKSIPSFSIVAGVPAKVIGKRD